MIHRKVPKKNKMNTLFALTIPAALVLSACDSSNGTLAAIESGLENGDDVDISISTDDDGNIVIGASGDDALDDGASPAGGVFAMSNILDENTIVAYARADDGTLSLVGEFATCLLYTSPSPRDRQKSRMPSSA